MSAWPAMNPEAKRLWVAALRSGDYRQTHAHLRDEFGYCCLGVVCEELRKNRLLEIEAEQDDSDLYFYNGEPDTLPKGVARYLNVNREVEAHLINMNDNGEPFTEIADWIEENL